MRRRRTGNLLAAVLLTVGIAGCSTSTDQRDPAAGGPSPEAATPSASATTAAAPFAPPAGIAPADSFAVGVRELKLARGTERPLPTTVWYPATGRAGSTAEHAAPVADGKFPVVVFSHGLTATPADYQPLLTEWAAAGLVVVAPRYPHTSRGAARFDILDVVNQPADASYVLTEVLKLDSRAGDPLRGRLATDRVAATGHSAGGVTTVGLFTGGRDQRLDAGIVLAGSALGVGTAFAGPTAPLLFVHGQLDDVVSYASGKAAYDRVPWPKAMLSLPQGDHGQSLLKSNNPAFGVVAETTADFLRWTLYGDPAAKGRLATGANRDGLATLDDRL
ncbi:alpha/beta hydrolase family protein [Micromonospora sp. NPDC003197]